MARTFEVNQSQYFRCSTAPVTTTPLSMACWFRPFSDTASEFLVSLQNAASSAFRNCHALMIGGGAIGDPVRAYTSNATQSAFADTTTGIKLHRPHHICGVWASATDRRVYLDGGSKGTDTTNRAPAAALDSTTIGAAVQATTTVQFTGWLAHAAIWNTILTDDEARALSLGVSPLLIQYNNLVAYWPLTGRHGVQYEFSAHRNLADLPMSASVPPPLIEPSELWLPEPLREVRRPKQFVAAATGRLLTRLQLEGLFVGGSAL